MQRIRNATDDLKIRIHNIELLLWIFYFMFFIGNTEPFHSSLQFLPYAMWSLLYYLHMLMQGLQKATKSVCSQMISWVISESCQVSLWSKADKIKHKNSDISSTIQDLCTLPLFLLCFRCICTLAPYLSSPSFIPSMQVCFTAKINKKTHLWYRKLSHSYLTVTISQCKHLFYSLDQVIWLNLASAVYNPTR